MKIKVLGTRREIKESAPYHSRHSGVIIDGVLLLDWGEKNFLDQNPKYILISHLHPDHAFFIRNQEEVKTSLPVFAPEDYKGVPNLNRVSPMEKFKVGSFSIQAIPTIHSKKVKSTAYLIEKGEHKILYTGDMIWIEKKYHHLLENLELVITEASFLKKGGMVRRDKQGNIYGHTGIPDLVRIFSDFTNNILLIHFGSWFFQNIQEARDNIKNLEKKEKNHLIVGYDGLKIDTQKLKSN